MTPEQERTWNKWVKSRPKSVQKVAKKYPAMRQYSLKSTGQIVQIYSYSEDGTVTVDIFADENPDNVNCMVIGDYRVFGVNPDDLQAAS